MSKNQDDLVDIEPGNFMHSDVEAVSMASSYGIGSGDNFQMEFYKTINRLEAQKETKSSQKSQIGGNVGSSRFARNKKAAELIAETLEKLTMEEPHVFTIFHLYLHWFWRIFHARRYDEVRTDFNNADWAETPRKKAWKENETATALNKYRFSTKPKNMPSNSAALLKRGDEKIGIRDISAELVQNLPQRERDEFQRGVAHRLLSEILWDVGKDDFMAPWSPLNGVKLSPKEKELLLGVFGDYWFKYHADEIRLT